jgi:tRNA (guanine37-N1)-methyltransferase
MSDPYGIEILTLFPGFFSGPLRESILGRGRESGAAEVTVTDIRDFARDRHRKTDDAPYGGGAGMIMKPEPLVGALEHASQAQPSAPRILLTPQGRPLDQSGVESLASEDGMILTCGRYEGVDQRVRDGWIDREISIGDFVLSGGEPAALVLVDAVVRLLPGVLGNQASLDEESFSDGTLEYPQYTRPREFRGREVPDVLLSGDHGRIAEWRRQQALERTRQRRPDLLEDEDQEE